MEVIVFFNKDSIKYSIFPIKNQLFFSIGSS